jgi:adenosylhomocysteine nucleosidase
MSTFDPEKTLIVMALSVESQGLFEAAGIPVHYTGVGKISSATKLTQILIKNKPKHILNLGSAGSRKWPIGTLLEVESTVRRDQVLPWMQKTLKLKTMTELEKAVCASADYIETGEAASQWDLMDMEVYSLASVCSEFNVPLTSVKYVTDNSDQNLRRDWDSQLKNCAQSLHDFYLSLR